MWMFVVNVIHNFLLVNMVPQYFTLVKQLFNFRLLWSSLKMIMTSPFFSLLKNNSMWYYVGDPQSRRGFKMSFCFEH